MPQPRRGFVARSLALACRAGGSTREAFREGLTSSFTMRRSRSSLMAASGTAAHLAREYRDQTLPTGVRRSDRTKRATCALPGHFERGAGPFILGTRRQENTEGGCPANREGTSREVPQRAATARAALTGRRHLLGAENPSGLLVRERHRHDHRLAPPPHEPDPTHREPPPGRQILKVVRPTPASGLRIEDRALGQAWRTYRATVLFPIPKAPFRKMTSPGFGGSSVRCLAPFSSFLRRRLDGKERRPASTVSPSRTAISVTIPSTGAGIGFSIFIASTITTRLARGDRAPRPHLDLHDLPGHVGT